MPNKSLRCSFFGHKLKTVNQQHIHIKEFACTNCGKEFTEDGYGRLVTLNHYWKKTNNQFKAYLEETYS